MDPRKRELVIVLILFALALCALLALYRLPQSGSTDLATKIALALLVAAVTRLLMLGLDTLKERDPAASFWKHGMRSARRVLEDEVLRDHLADAREIKVLKTWFPESDTIQYGLDLAIKQNGASVKLLLAHPDSKVLAVRSEGAGQTADYGGHHVIKALKDLVASARAAGNPHVEVGLYDSWPGAPIIWYDGHILLGFYLRMRPSPNWPWIEIEPGCELATRLQEQYDSLWKLENTIQLSSLEEIESWLQERKRSAAAGESK